MLHFHKPRKLDKREPIVERVTKSVKQLVEPKELILRKLIVERVLKSILAPENNSIMTLLMMISENNNHGMMHANKRKYPTDYSNSSNYFDKHHAL